MPLLSTGEVQLRVPLLGILLGSKFKISEEVGASAPLEYHLLSLLLNDATTSNGGVCKIKLSPSVLPICFYIRLMSPDGHGWSQHLMFCTLGGVGETNSHPVFFYLPCSTALSFFQPLQLRCLCERFCLQMSHCAATKVWP